LNEVGQSRRRRELRHARKKNRDREIRRGARRVRVNARAAASQNEDIDLLRDIADNDKSQEYVFGDGSKLSVDAQTASLLLIVYESLSGANQKKFEGNVYKSKKEFLKLVDFAKDKVG
jgi:hypothetical protein